MADNNVTTNNTVATEQAPSLAPVSTPTAQAESLEPMVLAANTAQNLRAVPAASPSAENYSVVVKAPPAGGMLAYLVGPGATIELQGIDLNKSTLAQEAGNLRITLPNGAEVLLLDYVSSAKDADTVVVTSEGKLPAQALLAALDGAQVAQNVAEVEPAAGPAASGGQGGGLLPPTILGLGVGSGEGIFSSVIGPFGIPVVRDSILTNEYPFEPAVITPGPAVPPGPANNPPLAKNDSFSTAVGKPITVQPGQLLANDSDPDGDPIRIISVQGASNGTVTLNNDGTVTFTPTPGFHGTGSYSYTITDGKGGTSTADVIIQIDPDPADQNNVIAADDAATVVAGRAITVNVLANDSDPEGDALVPGSVRIISGPDKGTATANPDGTISYQSVGTDPYFVTIVYEVSDARGAKDTATVTIEVIPAANNVIAVDDTGEIVPAGASKSFNVTGNDVDPQGDAFQITSITQPTRGTATFDAATGTITYNSVPSATGYTEVITYEITDARGAKDTATLTVRVEPTNNVSAVDDTADLMAGQDVRIAVLRNDFDAQGDSFSITRIVDQPRVRDGSGFGGSRGTVTINADGTITFTDAAGARDSAVVEFSYEIRDSKGATDIAVVRVTIGTAANGVDANNDTLNVDQNAARANVTAKLLANDFDPQGDTFKITGITQPSIGRGTVELVGDQVFFTPANGYNGPVQFSYTITDSKGATDTALVNINVTPQQNTDLNAGNDNFSTPFNTNLTITPAQLLANDNDPEGSVLTSNSIISFTQPANGTVTRDASGNFIYNPNDTFRGTDTFTYTIRDAQGDEATATVIIRVAEPAPLDNPVDAVNDLVILAPGETRSVNALTNDSAPDGGLAFVRIVDALPAGVTHLGNGVFSYTAPANTTGQSVSFRYEVRDIDGDTDIATVTFKVEGPVNSVDARDDAITMARNLDTILINAKANDVDPDGDAFAITRIVSVSSGSATIENGQVRFNFDADTAPRNGGTYTIVYEVTDARGAKDTATITVTVPGLENSVDARDDAVTMTRNLDSILINAKANDVDPQGDAFSITRIVSVSAGTATIENGQVRFNFDADSAPRGGGTYTIVYEVTDAFGAKDQATITVTVPAVPNNVDARDDAVTMARNLDTILINAKSNDVDPQGDAFSITRIVSVSGGSATIENGQVRFNFDADTAPRNGGTYTIVYEVTDALGAKDQATITVTVPGVVNSVDARDDTVTMARNVDSILINAKANDVDPQGDAFSITRIVSTSAGTATIENGQVRFNFDADSAPRNGGTYTIVYEVTDAFGAKDQATITVTVPGKGNTVTAVDDAVTMAKDVQTMLINAKANDFDAEGDAFSITRIVSVTGGGSATIENGQVRYTNNTREAGEAYITYEITDALGAKDTAVIKVTIVADTNTVVAVDDVVTMAKDVQTMLINAKSNDFDPQGDQFAITRIVSVSGGGTATIENGQVRYTNNTTEAGTAYITYEITDALGAKDTAVIKVNIVADTINTVVAVDDAVTMAKDVQSILINAKANDFDPQGDAFSITRIVSVTGGGTATIENGQVRYVNNTREAGEAFITYEITDSKGAKDTAVIKVTIVADTNTVVAVDDTVTMAKDVQTMLINAKANDYDPQGDAFSITRIVSVTGGGTATIENGQVRYTNNTTEAGTAYITYEITDSKGAKDTAVIKVNIIADTVNTVVAVDDTVTMAKDVNSMLINAKANDYDPQGDAFSITRIVSVTGGGSATIENGQVRYINNTTGAGTAYITYEITDSKGAKDTAVIKVNIVADTANSVVAVDDTATMAKNVSSILINAKGNDYDPQGDSFSITRIVSVTGGGTATIENGQVRYNNTTSAAGTAYITYEITDSKGAKDTAVIKVNIAADTVPNSVIANNDTATLGKDKNSVTINAIANDRDPEGDTFKITKIVSVSGPTGGTAKIVDGKVVYSLAEHAKDGVAKIVYEITDSKGAKDTATITVNIDADTPPAPNTVIANNDSFTRERGSSGVLNVLANDRDPQGDSFKIVGIVTKPGVGSAVVSADGKNIIYTATSGNTSYTTTLVYKIQDSKGATDTATVTINVRGTGNTPGGGDGDCPLTIDLNGDGISIVMQSDSRAYFDLNGDGVAEWTSWVNGSDDAILAIDRNGNGSIDGINEVFGGPGVDGFTELRRLEDTNGDGVFDKNDASWNDMRLWLDKNGNGISEEGELFTLDHFGITGINLNSTETSIQYGDAYISHQGSVTMADGRTLTASSVFYTNDSNGVLKGTANSDVLIYSSTADSIDGGQGADTLKVVTKSDITIGHDYMKGVEAIDLANNHADKLSLDINDVLNISDNGILTVRGDAVDQLTLTGDAVRGNDVTQNGTTYASYSASNGGTVLVELGLTVNTPEHQNH